MPIFAILVLSIMSSGCVWMSLSMLAKAAWL